MASNLADESDDRIIENMPDLDFDRMPEIQSSGLKIVEHCKNKYALENLMHHHILQYVLRKLLRNHGHTDLSIYKLINKLKPDTKMTIASSFVNDSMNHYQIDFINLLPESSKKLLDQWDLIADDFAVQVTKYTGFFDDFTRKEIAQVLRDAKPHLSNGNLVLTF